MTIYIFWGPKTAAASTVVFIIYFHGGILLSDFVRLKFNDSFGWKTLLLQENVVAELTNLS